jgi:hypothetical protein
MIKITYDGADVKERRDRSLQRLAIALLIAGALGATGCSDNPSEPPLPTEPPPEIPVWFFGLWGSGPNDVYAVGQLGYIAHFDGTSWTFQPSGTNRALTDVFSPDGGTTYYICGHGGVILRKSGGGSWSRMESGTSRDLYGIGTYGDQLYVAGRKGLLRRLNGSSWSGVGTKVILRDAGGAPVDTLDRETEIDNLTTVTALGIAGFNGVVLMEDHADSGPIWDWQLRTLRGGREQIYGGWGNTSRTEGNFVTTNRGRLFQLVEKDVGLSWVERYSPSSTAVTGLWVANAGQIFDCIAVSWNGEVVHETIELTDDPEVTPVTATTLLDIEQEFYDVWGAATDDFFVCGKSTTIYRYYDPAGGGSPSWHTYDLTLPAKAAVESRAPLVDKFGRRR